MRINKLFNLQTWTLVCHCQRLAEGLTNIHLTTRLYTLAMVLPGFEDIESEDTNMERNDTLHVVPCLQIKDKIYIVPNYSEVPL